ncbi:hypothetical protein D3C87_1810380 [compost metagenome]
MATPRMTCTSWSLLIIENEPVKKSIPPQPAFNFGGTTEIMFGVTLGMRAENPPPLTPNRLDVSNVVGAVELVIMSEKIDFIGFSAITGWLEKANAQSNETLRLEWRVFIDFLLVVPVSPAS